ncbi:MAG: hypothetical protein ABL997_14255 [Planctomycetota bacterium]
MTYSDTFNGSGLRHAWRPGATWLNESVLNLTGYALVPSSLAIGGDGIVRVAFGAPGLFPDRSQHYAERSGAVWQDLVLSGPTEYGGVADLVLDATLDPHIAYLDGDSGDLLYRHRTASGWSTAEVIADIDATPRQWDLQLDVSGVAHAVHTAPGGQVRYATRSPGGGDDWPSTLVGVGWGPKLVHDGAGAAHVLFSSTTGLKHAHGSGSAWSTDVLTATPAGAYALASTTAGTATAVFKNASVSPTVVSLATWDLAGWSIAPIDLGVPVGSIGCGDLVVVPTSGQLAFSFAAGSANAIGIAEYVVPPTIQAYCFGDGTGRACPCGNASAVHEDVGCLNSLGTGGRVRASGTASVVGDSLVLVGTQMPDNSALYFQGSARVNGGAGAVFGDGLRCVDGSIARLGTKSNLAGTSSYPEVGDVPIAIRGSVQAGETRYYQVWYRNATAFCTSTTFNLTNGVSVSWAL